MLLRAIRQRHRPVRPPAGKVRSKNERGARVIARIGDDRPRLKRGGRRADIEPIDGVVLHSGWQLAGITVCVIIQRARRSHCGACCDQVLPGPRYSGRLRRQGYESCAAGLPRGALAHRSPEARSAERGDVAALVAFSTRQSVGKARARQGWTGCDPDQRSVSHLLRVDIGRAYCRRDRGLSLSGTGR